MQLWINGEKKTVSLPEGCSINQLMRYLALNPKHVVVECEGTVFKGADTGKTIQNGTRLDIVRFVGGG